ncbi:MAG TPA: division/cell wall cluster transcriptional repressor MraZ [Bacteroidota bacterium]|nr:division/cell wall cluster transcriptional repressor MraZ [Bacteroidota bacterium]
MSSFKGSYTHSVDEKGRLNLPAKLRKYVSPDNNNTYVVTRGFEQCLFVYPVDEWAKVEARLRELSNYNPEHRMFLRNLLEMANEVQLDSQARLMVPSDLREYAKIRGDVRIIGTLDKIELWDPVAYEKYKSGQAETYEEIAQKVMK